MTYTETPSSRRPNTPWGRADSLIVVSSTAEPMVAIERVSTPRHGGYYVPSNLLHRIPEGHQRYALKWSLSRNWYEEDCAWAAVALAFPELFPEEAQADARLIAERYMKEEPGGYPMN